MALWNEQQRAEALAYHAARPDSIVVTGAQPFDRWFDRQPSTDRLQFCEKVGLRADQPVVLFVGSTASISAPDAELHFVRRWAAAVRSVCGHDVGILIRPHPYNSAHWGQADLAGMSNAAVFPTHQANPVDQDDRADYFDSLYHSAVVVGVNTSAMIEAAIVGRPVHAILAPEFAETQGGTLHFRYLLPENGGFLRVATGLDEHAHQLAATLAEPDRDREALSRFVGWFVRPNGLGTPATPVIVSALEGVAAKGRTRPTGVPLYLYPLRFVMWAVACVVYFRGLNQTQLSIRRSVKLHRRFWTQRWGLWIHRRRSRFSRDWAKRMKRLRSRADRLTGRSGRASTPRPPEA